MIYNLFSQKPLKAQRAYRVENLNPNKGISASLKAVDRKYVVCLCLPGKTVKTAFTSERQALDQLNKYKQLYKAIKDKRSI